MMRGAIFILALLCVGCVGSSQRLTVENTASTYSGCFSELSRDSMQRVEFAGRIFDFGTVREENGVVSHRFTFCNRSNRPIVITRTQTTCGCIRTDFSQEPILPGAEGVVTVSYDPYYRPGPFSKEIRIIFDGVRELSCIWIRGEVIPCRHPIAEDLPYDLGHGLRSNLKTLLLGGIFPGDEQSILLRYGNDSKNPMRLRFRVEGATCEALTIPDTALLAADERREIRLVYRMPKGLLGPQRLSVIPEVNGIVLPALKLTAIALPPKAPVSVHSPAIRCPQNNFLFEQATTPQPFDLRLKNDGGSPLRILSVDVPPVVKTDLRSGIEIAPDNSRIFASTFFLPSSCEGFHDRIYIVTDDPIRPLITINLNTSTPKMN